MPLLQHLSCLFSSPLARSCHLLFFLLVRAASSLCLQEANWPWRTKTHCKHLRLELGKMVVQGFRIEISVIKQPCEVNSLVGKTEIKIGPLSFFFFFFNVFTFPTPTLTTSALCSPSLKAGFFSSRHKALAATFLSGPVRPACTRVVRKKYSRSRKTCNPERRRGRRRRKERKEKKKKNDPRCSAC